MYSPAPTPPTPHPLVNWTFCAAVANAHFHCPLFKAELRLTSRCSSLGAGNWKQPWYPNYGLLPLPAGIAMEGPAGRSATPHAGSLSSRASQSRSLPFLLTFPSCIKEGSVCLLLCVHSVLGCWQVNSWSCGGKAWNSSFPSTFPLQILILSRQLLLQLSFPVQPTRSATQRGGDGILPDMLNLKVSPSCPEITQGGRQYLSPLHRLLPDTLAIKMSKQVSLWKPNSSADLPLPAAAPVGHLFPFNLTHALKMPVLSTSSRD